MNSVEVAERTNKMATQQSLKAIKTVIGGAKRICLFGIGTLLSECFYQLVLFLGREPDFLCDNAPEKWGMEFFGEKCISPSELSELRDETLVIITVKNYEDIYQQVTGMGIKDVLVCCYDRCYNTVHAIKRLEGDALRAPSQGSLTGSIKGKWTLITGSSRGIGLQIALGMARLGSNIIAHSRCVSHHKELLDTCSAVGVQVVPVAAELSDLMELDAMLSNLERLVPQIDIIFNNAAVSPSWPLGFWSAPSQDYVSTYLINTVAPIRVCQRLIPPMVQRGFGRVINITSSIQKRPDEMAYACSKAALDKFIHDLAPSLRGTGVMLTLVDPGWLRTDMGGPIAPHAVESVIPGAILGALLDGDINGRWFGAQDYAGLTLEAAIQKAKFVFEIEESKRCFKTKPPEGA